MSTGTASLPILDSEALAPAVSKRRLPLLDQLLADQGDMSAVERFSQLHDDATTPLLEPIYRSLLPATAPGPGQQYAFEVNLDACSGCKACVTACHSLNGLDESETWRAVGVLHGGDITQPFQQTVTTACHHCLEPACMKGCPVGAYEKNPETGIVRHLDDQCIGCQYCMFTCAYDVPQYNAKKGIVRKCDMCSDRLAEGEAPACVQACPTHAISIKLVDVNEARAVASEGSLVPGAPSSSISVPTTRYVGTRVMPANTLPADFHAVRPAHIHTPLVWMLVLTQLSVGAFWVGSIFEGVLSAEALAAVRPWHGLLALSLGLLALGASTAHLGRPQYAFRAMLGVRTSWLSREILTFGAFAGAAVTYAAALFQADRASVWSALPQLPVWSEAALPVLAPAVALTGASGVYCSVMLYHATRRRWWHGYATGFKFALTSVVLGLAFSSAAAIVVLASTHTDPLPLLRPWLRFAAPALAVVTCVKLLGELSVIRHRRDPGGDLGRSARLLLGELRGLLGLRAGLALFGGVVLPLVFFGAPEGVPLGALVTVALSSASLLLAGELVERVLFFAAMSAPRMPGVVS
ncbi:MAG: DmsC/YnfH family molybdoenzyme membrane anchor subunit [Polyangiales bacterium]|nr:dimethyl sulfoxide reductase anchor subunit [Myxococcales bacterium]